MPESAYSLNPNLPIAKRARQLSLIGQDRPVPAWLAQAVPSDLGSIPLEAFLNPEERAQADAYRFARRKESYLLGRLAAKASLSAFLAESDWTKIRITNGVFGQPLVHHALQHEAEISISHVDGFAVALAFPREHPMALDMELIDTSRAVTVRNELRFSPAEQRWMHGSGVEEKAALVMLWTVREALGKVLRCGIACPLELLAASDITPIANDVWKSAYQNFHQYQCLSWVQSSHVLSIVLPKTTQWGG
jgi:phosphopantetheinyl transferase